MATDLDYSVVCQVVLETKGDSLGSSLAVPLSTLGLVNDNMRDRRDVKKQDALEEA